MRLLKTLFLAFSLCACSSVSKPDTDLCVVNAPGEHLTCYNIRRDYDDDGNIKAGAKPTYRQAITVADLNKHVVTDPKGWANLKAYIKILREEYSKCEE